MTIRVVVLLDPSILLGKKSTESRSKYLQDKTQSNREIRNGKPFVFSLFSDLNLVVSQIGNEMEDANVRFPMKRGQYSRRAFCVRITQLFIV